MLIQQGDIVTIDFDPTVGHEPMKTRPAVVVSVDFFNNVLSSLVVVCPITSTVNGHPLHIEIEEGGLVHGCICLEQVRSVDLNARNVRSHGEKISHATMAKVLDGLGAIFGI